MKGVFSSMTPGGKSAKGDKNIQEAVDRVNDVQGFCTYTEKQQFAVKVQEVTALRDTAPGSTKFANAARDLLQLAKDIEARVKKDGPTAAPPPPPTFTPLLVTPPPTQ